MYSPPRIGSLLDRVPTRAHLPFMPTYEYLCSACGNGWEEIQKISEPSLEVCPKCGKSTAKRQISGGNFILKGGGWYADLYSSSPKKSGDGGGESKAKSEGAAKPDAAKPAESPKTDGGSSSSLSSPSTPTSTKPAAA